MTPDRTMMGTVEYEFTIHAICPVDGSVDEYRATLSVPLIVAKVLTVESILEHVAGYERESLYQEVLTARLASELGGSMTTVGVHSNVKVTVRS